MSLVLVMITVGVMWRLRRGERSFDRWGCRGRADRLDDRRWRGWLWMTVMAI
jgi:hypothetical protein